MHWSVAGTARSLWTSNNVLLNVAHQWSQRFRQTPTGRFSSQITSSTSGTSIVYSGFWRDADLQDLYSLFSWEEIQLDTIDDRKLLSPWKNSRQAAGAEGPQQSAVLLPHTTQTTHKRQVLRTKRWDCEDQLFLLETQHTTRRLSDSLLVFCSLLSHHSSCLAFWSLLSPPPPPPISNT